MVLEVFLEIYFNGNPVIGMTMFISIGVGRFRILGGQGLEYWEGQGGGQIPSRHMTS